MFGKRLISAVVLIALTACAMYFGGLVMLGYGIIFSTMGIYELIRLEKMEKTAVGILVYITSIAVFVYEYLKRDTLSCDELVLLIPALLIILTVYVLFHDKYNPKTISLAVFSLVYVTGLLSYAFHLRCLEGGRWFIWLILIVASGCDTFAYLVGSLIGKHKFTKISPKKSIEGCIGGILGACLLAFAYSCFIPENIAGLFSIDIHVLLVIIAFIGSIFSQIGDLVASAIKRHYDKKDFSNLIPGHGGILDRIDSILFVSPIIYFILRLFMN